MRATGRAGGVGWGGGWNRQRELDQAADEAQAALCECMGRGLAWGRG